MPYNSQTNRADIQALVPEDVSSEIIQSALEQSVALSLFPHVTLSTNQQRVPVLATLPLAYWVAGDTGLKQTTEMAWADKTFVVEELAVIVPIPEVVLDDAGFDIWGEVKPRVGEAIGRALDAAIFLGVSKPASWTDADLVAKAIAAGNVFARGTSTQAQGGIAEDINQLMMLVESDGFDIKGFLANKNMRGRLRSARATDGQKLMDVSTGQVEGAPITFGLPGLWPTGLSAAELITGDFSQGRIAVRQDLTYKILDQAVITDAGGLVVYNLPQQDMVALRVVARYAFAVANPLNFDQPVEANRFPFGVLRTPAA